MISDVEYQENENVEEGRGGEEREGMICYKI